MAKFEQSNTDQFAIELDDEALSTVVGGAADFDSYLAQHSVGGWFMRDVFAKPQIGRYTPR